MDDEIAVTPLSGGSPDLGSGQSRVMRSPRIDHLIEHDLYIAGQRNVVRLLLTNPYDDQIEILAVETPQTSSFEEYTRPNPTTGDNLLHSAGRALSRAFSNMSLTMVGVSVEIAQSSSRKLKIYAEKDSKVAFNRSLKDFDEIEVFAEKSASLDIIPEPDNAPPKTKKTATLRPRSTIVIPVSVMTRQWLLFTPQRFGLNVELTFKLNSIIHTQVINTQMDIRPPLSSMLYGAILGGFLGSLVASLNRLELTVGQIGLKCVTSVLMSVIAAVSLSRRGNTQAFVTVEDFYGAFFIGSLIGYGGVTFFEKAVLPTTNPVSQPG